MCKRLKDWYNRQPLRHLLWIVIMATMLMTTATVLLTHGNTEHAQYGVITHIVDGDTIHIDSQRYRLAWIDAPNPGSPHYHDAMQFVINHCPVGSIAEYEKVTSRNIFGERMPVVDVYCGGGDTTISQLLYRSNLAPLDCDAHQDTPFPRDLCD